MKFERLFIEHIAVAPNRTPEILLGTISVPNLARIAEIYTQDSAGNSFLDAGFVGRIAPPDTTLQVPPGTYKLKLANVFVQPIRVGAGQTVLAK